MADNDDAVPAVEITVNDALDGADSLADEVNAALEHQAEISAQQFSGLQERVQECQSQLVVLSTQLTALTAESPQLTELLGEVRGTRLELRTMMDHLSSLLAMRQSDPQPSPLVAAVPIVEVPETTLPESTVEPAQVAPPVLKRRRVQVI